MSLGLLSEYPPVRQDPPRMMALSRQMVDVLTASGRQVSASQERGRRRGWTWTRGDKGEGGGGMLHGAYIP